MRASIFQNMKNFGIGVGVREGAPRLTPWHGALSGGGWRMREIFCNFAVGLCRTRQEMALSFVWKDLPGLG